MQYTKTRELIDEYVDDGKKRFHQLGEKEKSAVLAAFLEDSQEFDYLFGEPKDVGTLFENLSNFIASDNSLDAHILKYYLRVQLEKNCREYIDEIFDAVQQNQFNSNLEKIRESGKRYGFERSESTGGMSEIFIY